MSESTRYGILYEYTPAMGDLKVMVRTRRPTLKANGYTAGSKHHDPRLTGWVLAYYEDEPTSGGHFHSSQLRQVETSDPNEPKCRDFAKVANSSKKD